MEIQFHANDSTTLRTADDHISTNSSAAANLLAAGGLIASNKTDIFTATWMNLTIWDWHIASNKTDIFSGVHLNETALLRTADDHISTNSSAAANLLAAGNLIASNKTNIFTATHTNESALALTLQNEIASNKTDVFTATVTNRSADRLTVQNEIASNKTDALQATYTNRTLSGNFTIMAQSMIPESGSGPTEVAPNSSGMTRGPLMWVSLDYAISPMQNATIAYVMPSDWDGGTLAASYYWTSTGGGGTSTWSWDGYCGIDASNMNAPWGTPQTVTDTVLAINQIHVSAETAATTMGGSPAPGSICWFQFSRNGGTLSTPASLMGVRVKYGVR